jgi:hypothetical protein
MLSPILKSFTFVPQPKISNDPVVIKRERIVSRLEDQKQLLADPLRRVARRDPKTILRRRYAHRPGRLRCCDSARFPRHLDAR